VVFPLANRRFALPTTEVVELIRTGSIHIFPHTTPGILGVLIRHGRILPVWDIAPALLGEDEPTLKYCLVARRNSAAEEPTAIPISGDCQLVSTPMEPPPVGLPEHVQGVLTVDGELVEVLELSRVGLLPNPDAAVAEAVPAGGRI
jgi:chemotaxis signal transduction protein